MGRWFSDSFLESPPYVRSPSQYQSRPQPQTEDIRSQEGCHSGSFCGFPRSEVLMGNRTTVTLLMFFWLKFLKKTMSRAWAKTKPGLFTQWRLQHRSHDSGQAVRLSIYTALGSAPRRELRMKTLDMVVGGRNGVRLQDIMYPVQGYLACNAKGQGSKMDIAQNCRSSKFMYRKENLDICLWGIFFIAKKTLNLWIQCLLKKCQGKEKIRDN